MSSPALNSNLGALLPNLLVLLAVAGGIAITEPDLSSDRVYGAGSYSDWKVRPEGDKARLWEDPFRMLPPSYLEYRKAEEERKKEYEEVFKFNMSDFEKSKVSMTASLSPTTRETKEAEVKNLSVAEPVYQAEQVKADSLEAVLKDAIEPSGEHLVLFVGMESGDDPGVIESRLRTRVAIASAFAGRCGMLPLLPKRQLRPCMIDIQRGAYVEHISAVVESYEGLSTRETRWFGISIPKVSIVYLDEGQLTPLPENMGVLVRACGSAGGRRMHYAYLGLGRSSRLASYMRAGGGLDTAPPVSTEGKPERSTITVYSAVATADQDLLDYYVGKSNDRKDDIYKPSSFTSHDNIPFGTTYGTIRQGSVDITLHRMGADDGDVCRALVSELSIRGVPVPSQESGGNQPQDAVLILSDMDRLHSRLLTDSFQNAWGMRNPVTLPPEALARLARERIAVDIWLKADRIDKKKADEIIRTAREREYHKQLEKTVRVFRYTSALDGFTSVSGSSKSTKNGKNIPEVLEPALGGVYAAEGTSQYDSLRRLPKRLAQLAQQDGVRYRAIGLFGSDVHDKLLLLKALKPAFPDAVFFTNDLDARLWQGRERASSLNLVCGSPYGLSFGETLQGNVPPFRSSYQSSIYLACLHAVDFHVRGDASGHLPGRQAEIHEISRRGDETLAYWDGSGFAGTANGRIPVDDAKNDPDDFSLRIFKALLIAAGCAMLLYLWWPPPVSGVGMGLPDPDDFWKVAVSVVVVLATWYAVRLFDIARNVGSSGEPVSLFTGISSLPVACTNAILVGLGAVMLLHELSVIDPGLSYPFSPSARGRNNAQSEDSPVIFLENTAPEKSGWRDSFWKYPSAKDLLGWCGVLLFLARRKKYPGICCSRSMFLKRVAGRERARRWKYLSKRNLQTRIVSVYARERLAASRANRMLRVSLMIAILAVVYYSRLLFQELPFPVSPFVRGENFRVWYEIADIAAKVVLVALAAFTVDQQIFLALGLRKLNHFLISHNGTKPRPYNWTARPEMVYAAWEHPEMCQKEYGERGLWEMPLLQLGASYFRKVSPTMILPFVIVFAMLVSRHSSFENTPTPRSEILLFILVMLAPLCAGVYTQFQMRRSFDLVGSRLRSGARFILKDKELKDIRSGFFDNELKVLEDLKSRTLYTFLGNPVFNAILLPLGGVGVLELTTLLSSLLK